mmetsp:Transcript_29393/g.90083  ORF Transcript_29393/g.90083 Transcript_29393/m.90083 type:complete len:148 (+) Transcript_29393:478-921(+)
MPSALVAPTSVRRWGMGQRIGMPSQPDATWPPRPRTFRAAFAHSIPRILVRECRPSHDQYLDRSHRKKRLPGGNHGLRLTVFGSEDTNRCHAMHAFRNAVSFPIGDSLSPSDTTLEDIMCSFLVAMNGGVDTGTGKEAGRDESFGWA